MLLGIGGVRALRLWSRLTGAPTPDVYHTNEGHAGFLGVERISELVAPRRMSFDEALEAVRAATVFTTHTPVPAGIDRFDARAHRALLRRRRRPSRACPSSGCSRSAPRPTRAARPACSTWPSWACGSRSAPTASRSCTATVSREMFDGLWPGFDDDEVPITSITNGVHAPTWVDRKLFELAAHARRRRTTSTPRTSWERVRQRARAMPCGPPSASCARSSSTRPGAARRQSWLERGASPAELGWTDELLDPDVLTIGFARRVPTYKRLTLMLRDPERLQALLLHPERPVQLVIAGKSHPADETGKRLIQQLVQFADDPEVRHRIVFLPNYDIAHGAAALPGLRRLAQQPAAPARGLRHVRHEGRAQRRAQPVDPRRLVGRVVRRRERLGHPHRRRRRGPRAP